ncbi:hypothetical protein ABIF86_002120 [Bradyrhizobium japonicum]
MLLVKERREQPPFDDLNHITTSNVRAGCSRQNRHDPSRSARSMPNELVDRTGLSEAISKRNGIPITRKDYSLIGLPLRPDAEESAKIRLRSARKAAGSEELRISSPRRIAPETTHSLRRMEAASRTSLVSWQQRPRQRGYNIAGPPPLRTSVLNLGPKATRFYPEPLRTRIGRKRHPFRSVPVCQTSILLSTAPLSEAEVVRPDRLFDGHGLREIPRLVHVGPHNRGTVIGKEL